MATVGSIAWYTHLYGTLPFLGEVSANSPAEVGLHSAEYPWGHKGYFDTFDHARFVRLISGWLKPESLLEVTHRRVLCSLLCSLYLFLHLGPSHKPNTRTKTGNLLTSEHEQRKPPISTYLHHTASDEAFRSTAKSAQPATLSTASHGATSSLSHTPRTKRAPWQKKSSTRMDRMTKGRTSSARASSVTTSPHRTRMKRPRARPMVAPYPRI